MNDAYEPVIARWYKKAYPTKQAMELLKIPAYYELEKADKAILIAFRAVEEPREAVECRIDESTDLEARRMRRHEIRQPTPRGTSDLQAIKDLFKKH